jgi:two-component system, LuxR family, response regulator FixJ
MSEQPFVLVVDDEESVRGSLSRLVRALGFQSRTFASAEAFLASLADLPGGERGEPENKTACLLVDIRMPGMSGIDLIEELGRRGISTPSIVMTGHTDEASLRRLETVRTIGLLEKPFSMADLKAMLARWQTPSGEAPGA